MASYSELGSNKINIYSTSQSSMQAIQIILYTDSVE